MIDRHGNVRVTTADGDVLTGKVIRGEHLETFVTSRSWAEVDRVVTVRWDDGDETDERPIDLEG